MSSAQCKYVSLSLEDALGLTMMIGHKVYDLAEQVSPSL